MRTVMKLGTAALAFLACQGAFADFTVLTVDVALDEVHRLQHTGACKGLSFYEYPERHVDCEGPRPLP